MRFVYLKLLTTSYKYTEINKMWQNTNMLRMGEINIYKAKVFKAEFCSKFLHFP
jgi:hypothetical protein